MARDAFFVVATDSDNDNTVISAGILVCASRMGLTTVATKPIATACLKTEEGLRSNDAQLLIEHMSEKLAYEQVNPIALQNDTKPYFAAAKEGRRLLLSQVVGYTRGVLMQSADLAIIEATGGWRDPINQRESMAGLAKELNLPVILVVKIESDVVNKCLLTCEAIARDGVKLAGWIADGRSSYGTVESGDTEGGSEWHDIALKKEDFYLDHLTALKSFIRAPCIAEIPPGDNLDAQALAAYISLDYVITS